MNIPQYHLELNALNVSTAPKRNYYIPRPAHSRFSVEKDSESLISLNGEWGFGFFDAFEDINFDLKDKITVPSNWQYFGYDFTQYTNYVYPFPFTPPVVRQNFFGVYKKQITLDKQDGYKYYINFDGVDSSIYLFVNGNFVGFDQVSHSPKEWDITQYLIQGKNTIGAIVPKWCAGSYLEDQDKIRLSGIFRDVYILKRPEKHIRSYYISYDIDFEQSQALVKISFDQTADFEKTIKVYYQDNLVYSGKFADQAEFVLKDIKLWNAEQPELYDIEIITPDEKICDYIGFRKIEIIDGVFTVNKKAIKIKGVNRHDSYYDTGYYAPIEYIKKDLELMKAHNINAVRTSHYPPAPEMLYLCDKMGFYVIDEADIESHGTVCSKGGYNRDLFDFFTDDPAWESQILDRVQKLVYRDINRPCVIMWSLGNESGWGRNTVKAAEWVECFDSSRLVHYESTYVAEGKDAKNFAPLKIMSKMYPSIEDIKQYLSNPDETRPLILCEFSHSMGNSCGDLKDYFDLFYSEPRLVGGLVWEWNDHSFPIDMDYSKPGYGGDWGDVQNDSNFCIDGLINYKREPGTNLKEYKNVICPIDASIENKTLNIINRYDFTVINKNYLIKYKVYDNLGETLKAGDLSIDYLAPGKSAAVDIDLSEYFERPNTYLLLEFFKDGFNLGHRHFALGKFAPKSLVLIKGGISYKENSKDIIIKGKDFEYIYDKTIGAFKTIKTNKTALIEAMDYNIWRAPIDNDRNILWKLKHRKMDRAKVRALNTTIDSQEYLTIKSEIILAADGLTPIFKGEAVWTIDGKGDIKAQFNIDIDKEIEFLPRLGLRMKLSPDFKSCSHFGYGLDSYVDKHNHTYKALYKSEIKDMFVNYHKPQENGAHFDTDYINIYGKKDIISISAQKPFSFNLNHYPQEALESAKHFFDLKPSKNPILCLDYMMSGIGSHSCGPELAPQYKLTEKQIQMSFNFAFSKRN